MENQEPTGDCSKSDPNPEVEFPVSQSRNLVDSDPDEASHTYFTLFYHADITFIFKRITQHEYKFLGLLYREIKDCAIFKLGALEATKKTRRKLSKTYSGLRAK